MTDNAENSFVELESERLNEDLNKNNHYVLNYFICSDDFPSGAALEKILSVKKYKCEKSEQKSSLISQSHKDWLLRWLLLKMDHVTGNHVQLVIQQPIIIKYPTGLPLSLY